MAVSFTNLNIALPANGNPVTITLPDIRMQGSVNTAGSAGQNDIPIIDFTNGPLAEADGKGTNLFKLFNSIIGSPEKLALVVQSMQDAEGSIAAAFAGVSL